MTTCSSRTGSWRELVSRARCRRKVLFRYLPHPTIHLLVQRIDLDDVSELAQDVGLALHQKARDLFVDQQLGKVLAVHIR